MRKVEITQKDILGLKLELSIKFRSKNGGKSIEVADEVLNLIRKTLLENGYEVEVKIDV